MKVNVLITMQGGIPYPVLVTPDYSKAESTFATLVDEMDLEVQDNPTCHRFAWNTQVSDVPEMRWWIEEVEE